MGTAIRLIASMGVAAFVGYYAASQIDMNGWGWAEKVIALYILPIATWFASYRILVIIKRLYDKKNKII